MIGLIFLRTFSKTMQNQRIQFDDTAVAFEAKSDAELRKTHFILSTMKRPWMVKMAKPLTEFGLNWGLPIKGAIRSTIYSLFCGGESIEECKPTIDKLSHFNVKTILDYSVEGETIEIGYDKTRDELIRICKSAKGHSDIPFCVVKFTGIGSTEVMRKAQADEPMTERERIKLDMLRDRAFEIAKAAKDNGLMFMIDAEESWIQDIIDDLALELMQEFNRDYAHVFNTFQMYRHDMLQNVSEAVELAKQDGFHLGVKLVRGAYMEKERDAAEDEGRESPIQPDKKATDQDYDKALQLLVENIDHVGICAGTHNEASCAWLTELMNQSGLENSDHRIFFAQLLGMSDNISFILAKNGYNVAKYVPYGPIDDVMPYLFRRAEENTSIAGQSSRELNMVTKELKRRKRA